MPTQMPPDPTKQTMFFTTRWTLVCDAASGGDTEAAVALSHLCETYWQPLYRYVRRTGKSQQDAEDLIQGFFAQILQHPKPVGNAIASQSTGGAFKVEASTWHRMRIFGSDELCYRFEIVDQGSGEVRAWEIPIKSLPKWGDGFSPSNYEFSKNGTIHWQADNNEVVFKMDEAEVFSISTDPIGIPSGANAVGTGEIRLVKP